MSQYLKRARSRGQSLHRASRGPPFRFRTHDVGCMMAASSASVGNTAFSDATERLGWRGLSPWLGVSSTGSAIDSEVSLTPTTASALTFPRPGSPSAPQSTVPAAPAAVLEIRSYPQPLSEQPDSAFAAQGVAAVVVVCAGRIATANVSVGLPAVRAGAADGRIKPRPAAGHPKARDAYVRSGCQPTL